MFENIVGHENQKQKLCNMIKNGTVSHAYLFCGDSGIGKSTIACEFAKEILGVENLEKSTDYVYISKKEDKKDIVIEQIRKEIIDTVYELPMSSNKKVYLIDGAEHLNMSAQNALLKTLEEPPKYIVLILIASNRGAFLPTLLSRVNEISFSALSEEKLKSYIYDKYNIKLQDDMLRYLNGSIGKANEIIQKGYIEKFLNIDKIYSYLIKKDLLNIYNYISNVDFNDIYMIDYLEFKLYTNGSFNCIKFIERAKTRLKNNGNYDIVVDSMILKIIDCI
ncbi:MAG: AAA family ATPase [Clostridia bacterium]